MTIPQPPIEAELFARRLDGIIGQTELQVIREIQPAIDALMQALDEEAEGGISDERLDQLTAPFNQQLQNLLDLQQSL